MEKYKKRLDEEQWGELYNKEQAKNETLPAFYIDTE